MLTFLEWLTAQPPIEQQRRQDAFKFSDRLIKERAAQLEAESQKRDGNTVIVWFVAILLCLMFWAGVIGTVTGPKMLGLWRY